MSAASKYSGSYNDITRFISYFEQIRLVTSTGGRKILEVGVGNKTVSTYLKNNGYTCTTCDIDAALEPDVTADIRALPLPPGSFDTVLACEVLEHIPLSSVPDALAGIFRVSRRYAVISIPYSNDYIELIIKAPVLKIFNREHMFDFKISLPHFWKRAVIHSEHCWEPGRKGTSIRSFKKLLKDYFHIISQTRPPLQMRQIFFMLEKKTSNSPCGECT